MRIVFKPSDVKIVHKNFNRYIYITYTSYDLFNDLEVINFNVFYINVLKNVKYFLTK